MIWVSSSAEVAVSAGGVLLFVVLFIGVLLLLSLLGAGLLEFCYGVYFRSNRGQASAARGGYTVVMKAIDGLVLPIVFLVGYVLDSIISDLTAKIIFGVAIPFFGIGLAIASLSAVAPFLRICSRVTRKHQSELLVQSQSAVADEPTGLTSQT